MKKKKASICRENLLRPLSWDTSVLIIEQMMFKDNY